MTVSQVKIFGACFLFFIAITNMSAVYAAEVSEEFSKAAFQAADQNKDGFVDEAEFAMDTITSFVELDNDNNKSLDKSELIDPNMDAWRKRDINSDNVLTLKEIMQGKMKDFQIIDKNKDGLLSEDEVILYDKAQ